jgi:histidine ammonia-lyase (EC 4.3.1.3)
VELSELSKAKINKCNSYLLQKVAQDGPPIYGVNTGFGSLCNTEISKEKLTELQINLLRSHACGTGAYVPHSIVKLMLLLKSTKPELRTQWSATSHSRKTTGILQ